MRIRKFFGGLFLTTGIIGVWLLLIDFFWTEPSETPAQFQEIVIYIGFVLPTLLTLCIGFKLFTNETPDLQTLNLNQGDSNEDNQSSI